MIDKTETSPQYFSTEPIMVSVLMMNDAKIQNLI